MVNPFVDDFPMKSSICNGACEKLPCLIYSVVYILNRKLNIIYKAGLFHCHIHEISRGRTVTRLVSAGHALCQHQQHHPNSSGGALAERFFFLAASTHVTQWAKNRSITGMYTLMSPEKGLKRMKRLVFQHMFSRSAIMLWMVSKSCIILGG